MAHFARLDKNNTVVSVHSVDNYLLLDENGIESEELGINYLKSIHGKDEVFVQTSYNNNIRCRFAGLGYFYDSQLDSFIKPKPYDSWSLNMETLEWDPPYSIPEYDKNTENCYWDEKTKTWKVELKPPAAPFPSWKFDENLQEWVPPVAYPDEVLEKGFAHIWKEETQEWKVEKIE